MLYTTAGGNTKSKTFNRPLRRKTRYLKTGMNTFQIFSENFRLKKKKTSTQKRGSTPRFSLLGLSGPSHPSYLCVPSWHHVHIHNAACDLRSAAFHMRYNSAPLMRQTRRGLKGLPAQPRSSRRRIVPHRKHAGWCTNTHLGNIPGMRK